MCLHEKCSSGKVIINNYIYNNSFYFLLFIMKKITKKDSKKVTKKNPITKKVVATKPTKSSWLSFLAIGNIIAFLAVILVNYLAVSLPIG
jgi:hypothetical protein